MMTPGQPQTQRAQQSSAARAAVQGAQACQGILSVRVDVEIIERLRASGDGWQKRVNDILRKEVGL